MMYSHCFFYILEEEDEIVKFDEKLHGRFEYDTELPYSGEEVLSSDEQVVTSFIHHHACETWDSEHHVPDHQVGIIVSDEELSKVLHMKKDKVRKVINSLLEKEVLGIVLLPDNRYAYHFVL